MKTTFTRECNFYIDYLEDIVKLNAISSISFETRYTELTKSKKTLHNRSAFDFAKGDFQDITTLSLTLYITEDFKESLFFQILGWRNEVNNLVWDGTFPPTPEQFKLIIEDPYSKKFYVFHDCVIVDLTLPFEKNIPGALMFTIDCPVVEVVDYFVVPYFKNVGINYLSYAPIILQSEDTIYNTINASVAISNEIEWHSNKNLHNKSIGLFSNVNPLCSNRTFSITSSSYLNHEKELRLEPYYGNINLSQGSLGINIDNALIMTRLSNEETFLIALDIKPSHKTTNISLSFDY